MTTVDPYDRLRAELGRAAAIRSTAGSALPRRHRRPASWRPRHPLALVGLGLLTTATAAAAVAVTSTAGLSSHATRDAPAVQHLTPVIDAINAIAASQEVLRRADPDAAAVSGPAGEFELRQRDPDLRGATIQRGALAVDVTISTDQICFAPHLAVDSRAPTRCADLPIPADHFPLQTGSDADQAWLVAIVPDGVTNVEVTGDNAGADTAKIEDNVAIAVVPGAHQITQLRWTARDGNTITQNPTP